MTKSMRAMMLGAAMTGFLAGTSAFAQPMPNAPSPASHGQKANKPAKDSHSCKGQNSCKGKGGCKSGDNGCKGKNSCKGKGGCATNGKGMMAKHHKK